jgi:hypothetical protein
MINVSAAMGGQFAWSVAEMTEEIRRMGPNPLYHSETESGKIIEGDVIVETQTTD